MKITYGRIHSAQKVVIYGPEGIGKSTFASRFPDPVFIDTEGGTKLLDVARLPAPQSWQDILDEVNYVANNPGCCKTLVIDTADWAEQQAVSAICQRAKKSGIEDFGYGKGYTYVAEEFQSLLRQLDKLIDRGINVVVTAHAKMRKFEQPDEMGAYDRWELKLSKQSAPLLKEWADMVLFANYKTYTVRTDEKKVKAQGGERTMYTSHHPCWDAKNRHGLSQEVPFTYESIRAAIEGEAPADVPKTETSTQPKTPNQPEPPKRTFASRPPQVSMTEMMDNQAQTAQQAQAVPEADVDKSLAPPGQREPYIPEGIPQELADLMRANNVDESELQMVVHDQGYYPMDTPVSSYDPDFIQGCLIAAWNQVFEKININRDNVPF
ncbi:MAG: ATP-binding protein [Eubacteriales bacterium]|nr:ATP-binding protein [Eubacteriales bacterium]